MLSFLGVKYRERHEILGILVWGDNCFSDPLGPRHSSHLSVSVLIISASASSQLLWLPSWAELQSTPQPSWSLSLEMSPGELKWQVLFIEIGDTEE